MRGVLYYSVARWFCRKPINTLKVRHKSSHEWLVRQFKDPYVERAKKENYRCRSAYKLIEIDRRFKILHPGHCVVDIGAAPGSWSQVAVSQTNALGKDPKNPKGIVVSLDRLHLFPLDGAILIGGCDFTLPKAQEQLTTALGGRLVDVVLSDMAPNATGVRSMDHDAIMNLVNLVLKFAVQTSEKGASLLMKIWEGRFSRQLEKDVSQFYDDVRWVKPKSSRSDSSETFILGRGFKT